MKIRPIYRYTSKWLMFVDPKLSDQVCRSLVERVWRWEFTEVAVIGGRRIEIVRDELLLD